MKNFNKPKKRYAELQQKYKEVKAKYDAWCKGLDES